MRTIRSWIGRIFLAIIFLIFLWPLFFKVLYEVWTDTEDKPIGFQKGMGELATCALITFWAYTGIAAYFTWHHFFP